MLIDKVQPILSDEPMSTAASNINVEFVKRQSPLFPNRLPFRRVVSTDGRCASFYFDMPECEEQLRSLLEIGDHTATETLQLFLSEAAYARIGALLHCFDGIPLPRLERLLILCKAGCVP